MMGAIITQIYKAVAKAADQGVTLKTFHLGIKAYNDFVEELNPMSVPQFDKDGGLRIAAPHGWLSVHCDPTLEPSMAYAMREAA